MSVKTKFPMTDYQRNALGHVIRCTRARAKNPGEGHEWYKDVIRATDEDKEIDAQCAEAVIARFPSAMLSDELIIDMASNVFAKNELPFTLFGALELSKVIESVVDMFVARGFLFVQAPVEDVES